MSLAYRMMYRRTLSEVIQRYIKGSESCCPRSGPDKVNRIQNARSTHGFRINGGCETVPATQVLPPWKARPATNRFAKYLQASFGCPRCLVTMRAKGYAVTLKPTARDCGGCLARRFDLDRCDRCDRRGEARRSDVYPALLFSLFQQFCCIQFRGTWQVQVITT